MDCNYSRLICLWSIYYFIDVVSNELINNNTNKPDDFGDRIDDDSILNRLDGEILLRDSLRLPRLFSAVELCSLPHVIGTGSYRIPRWYFNDRTNKCELFYYSGCCGNANNFPSYDSCRRLCELDPCNQPTDCGNGNSKINRFGYNRTSKVCQPFSYYGNGGNKNNFVSLKECKRTCNTKISMTEEIVNPCSHGRPVRLSRTGEIRCGWSEIGYGYCPVDHYCHIGGRSANTVCCPRSKDILTKCEQPLERGQGTESLTRWYYNQSINTCQTFQYKGYRGNENNFLSDSVCYRDCQVKNICSPEYDGSTTVNQICSHNEHCPNGYFCLFGSSARTTACCPKSTDDKCSLPLQAGHGNETLVRWFFDSGIGRCTVFTYSGLGGNQNNFRSKAECANSCTEIENPCPTDEYLRIRTESTTKPMYCKQNASQNFQYKCPENSWCHIGASDSTTMCCPSVSEKLCHQRLAVGDGRDQLQRFYFDAKKRQCRAFTYSGLKGNENNFLTFDDCEKKCRVFRNPCQGGMPAMDFGGKRKVCSASNKTCPDGFYCHIGATFDSILCCPVTSTEPCSLPLDQGHGDQNLRRFYFDPVQKSCETFLYKGEMGNENNFLTEGDCSAICLATADPCPSPDNSFSGRMHEFLSAPRVRCDANIQCPDKFWCHIGATPASTVCCPSVTIENRCDLPLAVGIGSFSLLRWYYNGFYKECVTFQYKGLQGNANNFATKEECSHQCPGFTNVCAAGTPLVIKGKPKPCGPISPCPPGYWCHVGASVDTTLCCPGGGNPCDIGLSIGQGHSQLRRFYFDIKSSRCMAFMYLGMMGNANNFLTRSDCETRCPKWLNPCLKGFPAIDTNNRPQVCSDNEDCPAGHFCHIGVDQPNVCCRSTGDPCGEEMNIGQGNLTNLKRWYFDKHSRSCQIFNYRGYKGNGNNFRNKFSCERTCPIFVSPCPIESGFLSFENVRRCDAREMNSDCPRDHWCHVGYDSTTTMCCPNASNPCVQPKSRGTGSTNVLRFYYDHRTRQCDSFFYNGVGGNQNNFLTKNHCERTCAVSSNPCRHGIPYMIDRTPIKCYTDIPCPSNYWCHYGSTRDSSVCCQIENENPCSLEMETGEGESELNRWFFDARSQECSTFTYKGNKGNQNQFLTKLDCILACGRAHSYVCPHGDPIESLDGSPIKCFKDADNSCPPNSWCHLGDSDDMNICCTGTRTDLCDRPVDRGFGDQNLNRFYYDISSQSCRPFIYGGQKGNGNNFRSLKECEKMCWPSNLRQNPCTLPVEDRIYCSPISANCPSKYYCHLGDSPETSICCPRSSGNPCDLPLSEGSGNSTMARFFYDSQENRCSPFQYRGLLGNENNFLGRITCEKQCLKKTKAKQKVSPCSRGEPLLDPSGNIQTCIQLSTFSTTCPYGYWCHVGQGPNSSVCCESSSEEPCFLPAEEGEGSEKLDRWFYDAKKQKCSPLIYRGSKGNRNNFLTMEACKLTCKQLVSPCIGSPATTSNGEVVFCSPSNRDRCPVNFWCHVGADSDSTLCCPGATNPCSVPLAPGTGSANLTRYYYNADAKQCVRFTYTGVAGNQNNFLTKAECEVMCPVKSKICVTGEPAVNDLGREIHCDPLKDYDNGCPKHYWCHPGDNVHEALCCPDETRELRSACELPFASGDGSEAISRWFYDQKSEKCLQFLYSGIGGNGNNFVTKKQCEKSCNGNALDSSGTCSGEPERQKDGSAKVCDPNDSEDPCSSGFACYPNISKPYIVNTCCPVSSDVCFQRMENGGGSSNLARWYFDLEKNDCAQFFYRGQGGNQNNFESKSSCMKRCMPDSNPCGIGSPFRVDNQIVQCYNNVSACPSDYYCHHGDDPSTSVCCPSQGEVCDLPMDAGRGADSLSRWFYYREMRRCLPFIYFGMGGNANKFLSQQSCESACLSQRDICPHGLPLLSDGRIIECSMHKPCPKNFICHINAPMFKSSCCPDPAHFCLLPPDTGSCENTTIRYSYNPRTSTCLPFEYSGCSGNLNNFHNEDICTDVCCDKGY